jgi:ABC-type Fe3+-hydroxamate transport system substrate-binding protein
MRTSTDDTGAAVRLPDRARRVVSLVPSLTEALAATDPGCLVGATDWCTHPAGLGVARVRGTKNPDLEAVLALAPDLVVANAEENRPPDLAALRSAGVPVWVTVVESLEEAFASLARLLAACGLGRPAWLDAAEAAWAGTAGTSPRVRAAVPVWRKPWMVAAADTFASDLLARLGVGNAYGPGGAPELRYPRTTPEEIRSRGSGLVVLPDEPYAFTAQDGPDAFAGLDVALVSGRHLTWYGPSLAEARDVLAAQLAAAFRA